MVDKPLYERIRADVGEVSEIVCFGEVVALSFPSEVSGAKFKGRHGVPLCLGCVEAKVEKSVCLGPISVWSFMMKPSDMVVDFSDLGGVDE